MVPANNTDTITTTKDMPGRLTHEVVNHYPDHPTHRMQPGSGSNGALRIFIARLPSHANAVAGKVDVLAMVFTIQARSYHTYNKHGSRATPRGEFLDFWGAALFIGQLFIQRPDDVAQFVRFLLVRDVAVVMAGELNVFLPR